MKMHEKPEWGDLATFVPNKREPLYNWFYYKEGFSKGLVRNLIKEFKIRKGDTVLDPFCGVGTALLACKQAGIDSIGFDVHPVAVSAAKVKTRDYDIGKLKEAVDELLGTRFREPDIDSKSSLIRRAFNRHTLEDVIFFRNNIMSIPDIETRDFCMLALMNVAMKCSYAWKDGAVIKIKRHPIPPLRKLLKRQLRRMLKDLGKAGKTGSKASAETGDARRLPLDDGCADAVITSPPYLNKIEYTKVYSIEEELFFKEKAKPSLRSYIGTRNEEALDELDRLKGIAGMPEIPLAAAAYFTDMQQVIKELHRVCRPGARLGIVVGNGCFPTGVVDSDVILSRMAESIGFKADEILVLNKRWCTRNRVEKIGITRESLLMWTR